MDLGPARRDVASAATATPSYRQGRRNYVQAGGGGGRILALYLCQLVLWVEGYIPGEYPGAQLVLNKEVLNKLLLFSTGH